MKKILYILGTAIALSLTACSDDDENTWEQYKVWHDDNETWYKAQINLTDEETGDLFYEQVVPVWANGQCVYMHWFNNRAETSMNLVPNLTSTVKAYYEGRLYNGTVFDKSENQADKILSAKVNSLVEGWQIALQNMHVGDTVQVVFPYELGYGASGSGSIPPYSALTFNIRLIDIPYYETRP